MRPRIRILLVFLIWSFAPSAILRSQVVERTYRSNIRTPQLFLTGNQQGYPVLRLNSGDRLQLEFDDMDGDFKNYYYTFVLCDYQWKPASLSVFDYIRGFTQMRISTYRYSSVSFVRYTHYQAFLPDANGLPTRSGNYLLKVFLDGDTSKLAFTKQFLVLEVKASVSASVVQPFTPELFNTHQRVRFSASMDNLNAFSVAQQVKAVVLQNYRWDIAQRDIAPVFVRGNVLDYNSEQVGLFPAGKEWRWLDLRSFRLLSDRVDSGIYNPRRADLYLKTDYDRNGQRYIYIPDYNGGYNITTFESINPFWQGDYANIHFRYRQPDGAPLPGQDLYLIGGFTQFLKTDAWKMRYDPETGNYTCTANLKQGYYNYGYVTVDQQQSTRITSLEGNYWETENVYMVLLYYRSLTDRNDQLIGMALVNARSDRPGFSF